jgi:hypothetical protein
LSENPPGTDIHRRRPGNVRSLQAKEPVASAKATRIIENPEEEGYKREPNDQSLKN